MRVAAGCLFLVLCRAASAQVHVEPPRYIEPQPNDIVLGGNQLRRTVTCDGNAVYVQGQENQVEVKGSCLFVRVQGNRNTVIVNRATTVPVEGNENRIYLGDLKTKVSERGERNRFERKSPASSRWIERRHCTRRYDKVPPDAAPMPAKIKLSEDVQPLTTSRNNTAAMLNQMKQKKRAFVLTVNGKPEVVVQSVEEYERLLDIASEANEGEGLRQALDDLNHGRERTAEQAFEEIRQRHGFKSGYSSAPCVISTDRRLHPRGPAPRRKRLVPWPDPSDCQSGTSPETRYLARRNTCTAAEILYSSKPHVSRIIYFIGGTKASRQSAADSA